MNAYEKNLHIFEKNKGTKENSIALKKSDIIDSDRNNRKFTKRFKRYFMKEKQQNKRGAISGVVLTISLELVVLGLKI